MEEKCNFCCSMNSLWLCFLIIITGCQRHALTLRSVVCMALITPRIYDENTWRPGAPGQPLQDDGGAVRSPRPELPPSEATSKPGGIADIFSFFMMSRTATKIIAIVIVKITKLTIYNMFFFSSRKKLEK